MLRALPEVTLRRPAGMKAVGANAEAVAAARAPRQLENFMVDVT